METEIAQRKVGLGFPLSLNQVSLLIAKLSQMVKCFQQQQSSPICFGTTQKAFLVKLNLQQQIPLVPRILLVKTFLSSFSVQIDFKSLQQRENI